MFLSICCHIVNDYTRTWVGWGCSSVLQHLPTMHKALGSISSTCGVCGGVECPTILELKKRIEVFCFVLGWSGDVCYALSKPELPFESGVLFSYLVIFSLFSSTN